MTLWLVNDPSVNVFCLRYALGRGLLLCVACACINQLLSRKDLRSVAYTMVMAGSGFGLPLNTTRVYSHTQARSPRGAQAAFILWPRKGKKELKSGGPAINWPPPGRDTRHLHRHVIGQIKSHGHTHVQGHSSYEWILANSTESTPHT